MRYLLLCGLFISCASQTVTTKGTFGRSFAVPDNQNERFWCGNTHTHTTNSDGDSSPDDVIDWYYNRGYNFVVIADHNLVTHRESNLFEFLVIKGEELTVRASGAPVHVNGLNLQETIKPFKSKDVQESLQTNINKIRDVGGVPHINHPNWRWALNRDNLYKSKNYNLFEIYNGSPDANNEGLVTVWDQLLSAGKRVYGIATDDAHHFKVWGKKYANPGRGWVCVQTKNLETNEIMEALDSGRFYASTGVFVRSINIDPSFLQIDSDADRTVFIGSNGKILKVTEENPATFSLTQTEMYVRVELYKGGKQAWIQPVFLK